MKTGEIWLAQLDPTVGREIQKTRPCVVISPNEMNDHLRTVIVAPMKTGSRPAGFRVPLSFQGKHGLIVLDQISNPGPLAARQAPGSAAASNVGRDAQDTAGNVFTKVAGVEVSSNAALRLWLHRRPHSRVDRYATHSGPDAAGTHGHVYASKPGDRRAASHTTGKRRRYRVRTTAYLSVRSCSTALRAPMLKRPS